MGTRRRKGRRGREGTPTLELEQTRFDVELGIKDPIGSFNLLNVRFGRNDYEHVEVEPSGEIGSTFANEAWELRIEGVYELEDWTGAAGVQHTDRAFSAIGEEAFTPPVDTVDTGFFWVGQRAFPDFDLETGLRLGRVEHDPSVGSSADFTTYAGSVGIVLNATEAVELGIVADVSSRAPVSEELYSNGPHLVTNAFEIGDPDLDEERAASIAASLRLDRERWWLKTTVYYTQFADFIYEAATGDEEDGLPVFRFRQDDARFIGLDLEAGAILKEFDNGSLEVRGILDVVDAELDVRGDDDLPRIPPMRYGVGLEFTVGRLTASIDYFRVAEQDDVGPLELTTDRYEDLRAYVNYRIPLGEQTFTIFFSGRNLTDDEQRYHTSFIKDLAPAPGRSIESGVRLEF